MRFRLALVAAICAVTAPLVIAQPAAKADPAQAQPIVTKVCAACHATDGNSASPANPVLAGQHADYTAKQLANFKSGERKDAKLVRPVPLYWVYVTAWATPDGVVQFRDDIYARDGVGTSPTSSRG